MGNPSPSQVPPHGTGKPRRTPPVSKPGLLFAQKLGAIKSPGLSDRGEVHVEAFGLWNAGSDYSGPRDRPLRSRLQSLKRVSQLPLLMLSEVRRSPHEVAIGGQRIGLS